MIDRLNATTSQNNKYCSDSRWFVLNFDGKQSYKISKMRSYFAMSFFNEIWNFVHDYVDCYDAYPVAWPEQKYSGKTISFQVKHYNIVLLFNADIVDKENWFPNFYQYVAHITNNRDGGIMTLNIEKFEANVRGEICSSHGERAAEKFVNDIIRRLINDEVVADEVWSY